MRLGLLAVALLAVGACTRPNPGFGEQDSEGSTKGSGPEPTSDSAEPPDGSGPEPGTGGSTLGDSADVTSAGSNTEGSATDNTSNSTAESGGCMPDVWHLQPTADTFIVLSEGPWCGGLACEGVNFGGVEIGPIEDLGPGYRAYLLMSFDLSVLPVPQASYSATLEVSVTNGMPIVLQAVEVFPTEWGEGNGLGTLFADGGEATWLWSSNPDPWTTPGSSGTFETVLASASDLGLEDGPAGIEPHPLVFAIANSAVVGWLEGPDIIHLAVTLTDSLGEAGAFTTESANPPVLTFAGC